MVLHLLQVLDDRVALRRHPQAACLRQFVEDTLATKLEYV
jgi:hypothetical protein